MLTSKTRVSFIDSIAEALKVNPHRVRWFVPKGILLPDGSILSDLYHPLVAALAKGLRTTPGRVKAAMGSRVPALGADSRGLSMQQYLGFCRENLLAQIRENLDREFADSNALRRDQFFESCRNFLESLGIEETTIYFYDPLNHRIIALFSPAEPDQEIRKFAAGSAFFQYQGQRFMLRIRGINNENFLFAGKGELNFPEAEETVKEVGGLMRLKMEAALRAILCRQGLEAQIQRLRVINQLSLSIDCEMARAIEDERENNIWMISMVMGVVPFLFQRLRSATIALWDKERNQLHAISSLGVDLKNLEGDSFALAQEVLLRRKSSFVHAVNLRRNGVVELQRAGDFMIFPFYQGAQKENPLGVISISFEAGRYLEETHVEALESLVETLRHKLDVRRILGDLSWAGKHDGLTGLLNHRTGMAKLEEDFNRASGEEGTLAYLMLDIDHFKQINDQYGHKAGDYVLKQLSRIVQGKIAQQESYAFRYGGEEFAIVIKGLSRNAVRDFAEQLRSEVEKQQFDIGFSRQIRMTISVGAAIVDRSSKHKTSVEVIEVADKKLYDAKRDGRNRIRI